MVMLLGVQGRVRDQVRVACESVMLELPGKAQEVCDYLMLHPWWMRYERPDVFKMTYIHIQYTYNTHTYMHAC